MIDLTGEGAEPWPDRLEPVGENTLNKEPFSAYWSRHGPEFSHLDPRVVEQWVHRHFRHSDYAHLALAQLRSRLERWTTERILKEVYVPHPVNPEWDYQALKDHHTGRTMLTSGTWDYPILILRTPDGAIDYWGQHPEVRFFLIEGHLRHRFLSALAARGDRSTVHDVLVLELTR